MTTAPTANDNDSSDLIGQTFDNDSIDEERLENDTSGEGKKEKKLPSKI